MSANVYRDGAGNGRRHSSGDVFRALDISGLALDIDFARGVTLNAGNVSQADDQSGNARHFSQATAADQPLFEAAGFNGRPCARFDGVTEYLLRAATWALTAAEAFIVVAADADPPATNTKGGLWRFSGLDQGAFFPASNGIVYQGFGSTTRYTIGDPTPTLAAPRIFGVTSAPGAWSARLDGAALFSSGTNTVGWPAAHWLGATNEGGVTNFFAGRIARALVYDHALSASERAYVTRGLGSRYVIAVTT